MSKTAAGHEQPHHEAGHGTKAVIAALLANTGIAITKFIAFILPGAS